ncbi:MAG: 4a-hydroxytetrahydrobiopterin dehydratase [Gemmatimonadetes bacterium]|nr:4a-hydroxytetrahydrobiopterin dehydratase [Gemmatimonadota bacterium]
MPAGGLASKKCVPCKKGTSPVAGKELERLLGELGGGWRTIEGHHLEKEYTFPNFVDALAFTNRVGAIAEEQGHHPDIMLGWGKVRLTIWTHSINGLSESDFILGAKADSAL